MPTYKYENGFGASVIDFGYGSEHGLMEMAVLHGGDCREICYATPVMDDIRGWLKPEDVNTILAEIRILKPNPLCTHQRPMREEDE